MKAIVALLFLLLFSSTTFGAKINREIASLLNAQFAAGLVPAKEGRLPSGEVGLLSGFGVFYDLSDAFSLGIESLEEAILSSEIEYWTLGAAAPLTGIESSWVVLDRNGVPFLSISFWNGQPDLVVVKQVVKHSEGTASFENDESYLFRCEITSKPLALFLRGKIEERKKFNFAPDPNRPIRKVLTNPFEPPQKNGQNQAGDGNSE